MRQKQFLHQSCYKLMFFMGICDVFCMSINGLLTGYYGLKGYEFCSNRNFNYIMGVFAISLWVIQSDCGMFLALNRCLEMFDPQINQKFFKGSKTCYWILIAIIHSACFAIFSRPVIFSSNNFGWFFNPHSGYFTDYGTIYYSTLHTIHNLMVFIVIILFYIIFVLLLFRKSHIYRNHETQIQRDSYLQVFIICVFNGTAAGVYNYVQFFPVPEYVVVIGHFGWFFAHAAPSIIYIFINKTIRKQIINKFKKIFKKKDNLTSHNNNNTTQQSITQNKINSSNNKNTIVNIPKIWISKTSTVASVASYITVPHEQSNHQSKD